MRERIKVLEGQNRLQLQNVDSLQKIIVQKERENQKLRGELARADRTMRTDFVKMEDFIEEIEGKYKEQLGKLEASHKDLILQIFGARAKHTNDGSMFQLSDDEEGAGEVLKEK